MDVVLKFGFTPVVFNCNRKEALKKGKLLFQSRHVYGVTERRRQAESNSASVANRPNGNSVITAHVTPQTSVNNPAYKVLLKIDSSRTVIFASCECKAGAGQTCKHIIAVVCYVNSNESSQSKTSCSREWGKPSNAQLEKYRKGARVSEIIGVVSVPQVSKVQPSVPAAIFKQNCPLVELLMTNPSEEDEIKDLVQELLMKCEQECEIYKVKKIANRLCSCGSPAPPSTQDQKLIKFYEENVQASPTEISQILWETRPQAKCKKWFDERKKRITASSKAHRIIRRKTDLESLASELFSSKVLKSNAVMYGTKTEKLALKEYTGLTGNSVTTVGLVVNYSKPWLSCSPDGVVLFNNEMILLEIKCPFTLKDKPATSESQSNVAYIRKSKESGEWFLSPSHMYYTQVQISMFVVRSKTCHFYVFSPKGSLLVEVQRDDGFIQKNVSILELFYFSFYLPVVVESLKS